MKLKQELPVQHKRISWRLKTGGLFIVSIVIAVLITLGIVKANLMMEQARHDHDNLMVTFSESVGELEDEARRLREKVLTLESRVSKNGSELGQRLEDLEVWDHDELLKRSQWLLLQFGAIPEELQEDYKEELREQIENFIENQMEGELEPEPNEQLDPQGWLYTPNDQEDVVI